MNGKLSSLNQRKNIHYTIVALFLSMVLIQCRSSEKSTDGQNSAINKITYEDVNKFDRNGVTALMIAAAQDDGPLIRTLIQSGAYINQQDHSGKNALIYAARACNQKAFNFLANRAGQVFQPDVSGRTPLFYAAMAGCWGITEYITEVADSVTTRDKLGMSPLMVATRYHHTEIAKLLLNKGAEVNAQDHQGRTALYHAVETPVWVKHKFDSVNIKKGEIRLINNSEVERPDYEANRSFFKKVLDGIKSVPRRTANLFRKLFNKPVKEKKSKQPDIKLNDLTLNYAFEPVRPAGSNARIETIRALKQAGAMSGKKDFNGVSILELANKYKMNDIIPLL